MSITKSTTDKAWAIVAWFTIDPGTVAECQQRQVWRAGVFDSPEEALAAWTAEDRNPSDIIGYVPISAGHVDIVHRRG